MIVDPLLLAYITFTFVLVITPGSTTAVVVRNTLIAGRVAGLTAATGAATANTTHAVAAGLGLGLVFARWPYSISVLRIAGALYLAWLGLMSLARVARYADGGVRMLSTESNGGHPSRRGTSFRQGLAVNLLNPAIATFYLVVVPSFVPRNASRGYFAALAAIHVSMALICHSIWALALDRLRRLLRPPLARRVLEGATGIALLALAAMAALPPQPR